MHLFQYIAKRDNLPGSLDDFLSQSTGSPVYEIAGNCNLKGTITPDNAELAVEKTDSCTKPSLKVIFEKLFPIINLQEATQGFILSDQYVLDKLDVVCKNTIVF